MTAERINAMVASWADRLGLSHWQIQVDWSGLTPNGEQALVHPADSYDTATLQFHAEFTAWTPAWAEWVVVHELLHLVMRDQDSTVEAVIDLLPAKARALAENRYEHEAEGVVDRLAAVLVALYRQELPTCS